MNSLNTFSRALLAAIFVSAGLSKVKDRAGTVGYMQSKNLRPVEPLYYAATAAELGGSIALIIPRTRGIGAAVLSAFLIPTTLIFHDFWRVQGPERQMQAISFFKNLSILGGLGSVILSSGLLRATAGQEISPGESGHRKAAKGFLHVA